jgi:hypothetical protein
VEFIERLRAILQSREERISTIFFCSIIGGIGMYVLAKIDVLIEGLVVPRAVASEMF